MTPIPEVNGPLIQWAQENPTAIPEAIRRLNLLTGNIEVVVTNTGSSGFAFAEKNAILTISTKDIRLGTVTGSKASNAALSSLMTALKTAFSITDTTS